MVIVGTYSSSSLLLFYRWTLESLGSLEPRRSALEEDFEEEEEKEDNDQPVDEIEDRAYEKVHPFPSRLKATFFYHVNQILNISGSDLLIYLLNDLYVSGLLSWEKPYKGER